MCFGTVTEFLVTKSNCVCWNSCRVLVTTRYLVFYSAVEAAVLVTIRYLVFQAERVTTRYLVFQAAVDAAVLITTRYLLFQAAVDKLINK